MKTEYIKHSDKVDFREWNLDSLNDIASELLREKILAAISEVIQITSEYKVEAYFPHEWITHDGLGGALPSDPLQIYVELPFGADEFSGPIWSFSLSDLVESLLDLNQTLKKELSKDAAASIKNMRNEFAAIVERLDTALAAVKD